MAFAQTYGLLQARSILLQREFPAWGWACLSLVALASLLSAAGLLLLLRLAAPGGLGSFQTLEDALSLIRKHASGFRIILGLVFSASFLIIAATLAAGDIRSISATAVVAASTCLLIYGSDLIAASLASETRARSSGFVLHLSWVVILAGILLPTTAGGPFPAWRLWSVAILAGAGQLLNILYRLDDLRPGHLKPSLPPLPPARLEKFELTVARSPRPAPPIEPGEDSVLVESGSFRVDVSRLLDKLAGRQLTDPRDFILCWLRCAVASEARRISLDTTQDGLEMRFDGRPFSAIELDNPYAALLDEDAPESRRGRHFAYGLLGVQRLEPDRVEVFSGPENDRKVMLLQGKETGPRPATETNPRDGTVIRIHWRSTTGTRDVPGLLARAADSFGLADLDLTVDGRAIPSHPWEAPARKATGRWTGISKDGWRGAVCHFIPAPRALPTATIHLYVLGTLIDHITRHQYSAFEAYLACDDLALDISQTKVVENEKLEQGLRTLL